LPIAVPLRHCSDRQAGQKQQRENSMFYKLHHFPDFLSAKVPHRGKRETCVVYQLGKGGARDPIMTQMHLD
jgi:hypothetical protein